MLGMDDTKIPPIPTVMHKVLLFDPNRPDAGSDELESLISADKGICSKLLKTSNSAFYGRSGKIKTLRDAITLLGLKNAKNLILMMSMKDLTISLKGDTFARYMHEFPVLTALVAFDLCKPAKLLAIREEVFLSGLLLKVGMAVFGYNQIRHYEQLLERSEQEGTDILELERQVYKIDHIEIGKRLFETWSMPDYLQDVMAGQQFTTSEIDAAGDILRITILASVITKNFLKIFTPVTEKEIAFLVFEHYEMDDSKAAFYDWAYYDLLKSHPFYQLAVAG